MEGLTNTPGQYYALSYWLGAMLFIYLNKRRMKGWKLWATQVFFLCALVTFMVATDGRPKIFFIPFMLTTVALIFAFIYVCCDFPLTNAGYYCARAFIVGEFAASFEWQLYYYAESRLHISDAWWVRGLFLLVIHSLVFGSMFYMERRFRQENQKLRIRQRGLFSAAVISLAVFTVSNLSYLDENTPFSSQFTAEVFIIRTLVDLGGLVILYAYHLQLQELNTKLEVENLQSILHMQYNNYRVSEESVAMVNQKYHDLKHQIAILRSEISNEEKLDSLERMETEIKAYEARNKTGHKVLDTILTAKSLQCQGQGISLTCVADGEALGFMDTMDIAILFGNALDNAIESVHKIQDPEKRLIHLTVSRQKNFLRIRVENCYEGKLVFEDGLPSTTKKDKEFHGYGIKSIKQIAAGYGGSVTIQAKGGWFELRVLIPLGGSCS